MKNEKCTHPVIALQINTYMWNGRDHNINLRSPPYGTIENFTIKDGGRKQGIQTTLVIMLTEKKAHGFNMT